MNECPAIHAGGGQENVVILARGTATKVLKYKQASTKVEVYDLKTGKLPT